jgi:hypothetical protein
VVLLVGDEVATSRDGGATTDHDSAERFGGEALLGVLLVMLAEAHNSVNFLLQLFCCFATLV